MIVGKSMPEEGEAKCLAFVSKYDTKPKRRLFELLKSQGMQPSQMVTFLSDGGEPVRNLPQRLNSGSEHWLDWFHIYDEADGDGPDGQRDRLRDKAPGGV